MKFLLPILLTGIVSNSQAWLEEKTNDNNGGEIEKSQMKVPHIPAQSRIVGGFEAESGKYPFFVSWEGCGASLIAKDVILTAAHCQGIFQNTVRIGQYRKFGSMGQGLQRNIVQRIPHPKYSDSDVNYDYMVMKLNEAVTDDYTPIQLNGNGAVPMDEQILSVIGFGALNQQSQSTPARLQQVDVNYFSSSTCNGLSGYQGDVKDDTMFCAGVEGGGKDSCQGDSGGPIFYQKQDGSYEQVGIVSWGIGCAQRNYPGVYSRISGELDWIQEQVCNISAIKPAYCGGDGGGGGGNNSPVSPQLPPPPPPTAQAPPQGTVPVRIDITYDRFASEVDWKFEQDGQIVLSYNGLSQDNSKRKSYRVNLIPGGAVFTINDGNRDGICCGYGEGSYTIVAETFIGEVPLAISSGDYGQQEVKNLDVPSLGQDDPSGGGDDDYNGSSPSPAPVSSPITPGPSNNDCSDSSVDFFVNGNAGNRTCQWLRLNMGRYGYLCAFFDVAIKCQSLCDTCQYLQ